MRLLGLLFLLLSFLCCRDKNDKVEELSSADKTSDLQLTGSIGIYLDKTEYLPNLTELKRCDILIKPNHNWLPGSAFVEGGSGFGHCVMVIEDCEGSDTDSVLRNTTIFESNAREVPDSFQVRKCKAYYPGNDLRYANLVFSPLQKGYRYRLRMKLTEPQKDSIIAFVLRQDNCISSWRTAKRIDNSGVEHRFPDSCEREHWYCSLLIWQAFYHVLGIDIDKNRGLMVYPNDVINSSFFDKDSLLVQKRVRF